MLSLRLQNKFSLPVKLLWVFTGMFSLGQLQKIEISPQIAFYLHDLFITGWLMFVLIYKPGFYSRVLNFLFKILKDNNWLKLLSAFIILSVFVTAAFCLLNQTVIPFLYLARLAAYAIFALSINLLLNSSTTELHLRTQLLFAGGMIAVLGLLQIIFLPDVRFLYLYGWDDHFYRLISTLFDPAFTGLTLLMTLLFSFKINSSTKLINILRFLLIIAIVLTFSRATYLAGLISFLYFVLVKSKFDKKFIKTISAIVIFVVFGSLVLQIIRGGEGTNLLRTSTVFARLYNSVESLQKMSKYSLLTGNGWFTNAYLNSGFQDHSRVPDNIFVMLIYSLGLPGFLVLLSSFYKIVRPKIGKNPEIFSILIAILIHSQFNNALFQPFVWLYLWWGIAVFYKTKFKALNLQ